MYGRSIYSLQQAFLPAPPVLSARYFSRKKEMCGFRFPSGWVDLHPAVSCKAIVCLFPVWSCVCFVCVFCVCVLNLCSMLTSTLFLCFAFSVVFFARCACPLEARPTPTATLLIWSTSAFSSRRATEGKFKRFGHVFFFFRGVVCTLLRPVSRVGAKFILRNISWYCHYPFWCFRLRSMCPTCVCPWVWPSIITWFQGIWCVMIWVVSICLEEWSSNWRAHMWHD